MKTKTSDETTSVRVAELIARANNKGLNNAFLLAFEVGINEDIKQAIEAARKQTAQEIFKDIADYQNSYPQDIFLWNNKEKLAFNRGRFNQHCFEIVENMRGDLMAEIKKKYLGDEK